MFAFKLKIWADILFFLCIFLFIIMSVIYKNKNRLQKINICYILDFTMLDGELAVPCNPQTATAGLNTHGGLSYGKPILIRDVDDKVLCNRVL